MEYHERRFKLYFKVSVCVCIYTHTHAHMHVCCQRKVVPDWPTKARKVLPRLLQSRKRMFKQWGKLWKKCWRVRQGGWSMSLGHLWLLIGTKLGSYLPTKTWIQRPCIYLSWFHFKWMTPSSLNNKWDHLGATRLFAEQTEDYVTKSNYIGSRVPNKRNSKKKFS
jgi:hypothetical protein